LTCAGEAAGATHHRDQGRAADLADAGQRASQPARVGPPVAVLTPGGVTGQLGLDRAEPPAAAAGVDHRLVGVREGGEVGDELTGVTKLTKVSVSVTPSDRGWREIEIIGGLRPTAVKNEMGARLATPPTETVLTQPIARGMMLPISSL
jgi:hypothetical protein